MKHYNIEKKLVNAKINSLKKVKVDPNNIVLNAAAFQDQIMHKLGLNIKKPRLNGRRMKINAKSRISIDSKNPNAKDEKEIKGKNMIDKLVDKEEGDKEILKRNKKFLSALTFAEKTGIEKIKSFPLSIEQWKKLENQSVKREDFKGECPICLDKLSNRETIILSCSHVFHLVCLRNFEKYANVKKCPLCRCEKYECKAYTKDKEYFVKKSIIVIQSDFRGYNLRHQLYLTVFKDNMPKNKHLRGIYSKWKLKELSQRLMNSMKVQMATQQKLYNECFKKYDELKKLKEENLKLQEKLGLHIGEKEKEDDKPDWKEVINKMEKRDNDTCAICLSSFGHKELYILDCTHCFHKNCLDSFEKFDPYYKKRCPICRAIYTKKEIKK